MRLLGKQVVSVFGALGMTAATLTAISVGTAAAAPPAPVSADENGVVRTAPGDPIQRPQGFGADSAPDAVAKAFVASGDADLAVKGDVETARVEPSARGGHVVRLQQTVNGIPVLGSQVVVDLDRNNNIRTATSEALPGGVTEDAFVVTPQGAAAIAVAATAKAAKTGKSSLRASKPSKWIYDPRILGGPGLPQARSVWRTEVTSTTDPSVRRMVLVDGTLGAVALNLDLVNDARVRRICNANNTETKVPCNAPYARVEGGPASAVSDVNKAYDYSGDTYNFFKNQFNRDSLNNAGMPLISTVRYCQSGSACPFQNAFWNGAQMVYGAGFANADDVVGHELTHGVTEFSSDLFYYMQSGAINESLSDIFGEYIDLTNGKGTDTAAARWKMGEDVPGFGALRDMKNPPAFSDPDRTGSGLYYNGTDDNGGVHTNSGVSNKFTFLITDGGTFNGRTVVGQGIPKAAAIIYRASQLLTSAGDFKQLASALRASCNTLIGTKGITAATCAQVNNALLATQMDVTPARAPMPAAAPVCPTGKTAQNIYTDGLESPNAGWTRNNLGAYRFIYTNEQYGVRYATQGRSNVWAPQLNGTSDLKLQRTANWTIPAGQVFLRFAHAFEFESYASGNYDGGVLEYSINNGATWLNAGPLIVNNGYRGVLANGNPLAGRSAFVGVSRGYITTRLNMASLVGKNVRFRFRTVTDSSVGWYGWFVDDVRLYKCV